MGLDSRRRLPNPCTPWEWTSVRFTAIRNPHWRHVSKPTWTPRLMFCLVCIWAYFVRKRFRKGKRLSYLPWCGLVLGYFTAWLRLIGTKTHMGKYEDYDFAEVWKTTWALLHWTIWDAGIDWNSALHLKYLLRQPSLCLFGLHPSIRP